MWVYKVDSACGVGLVVLVWKGGGESLSGKGLGFSVFQYSTCLIRCLDP